MLNIGPQELILILIVALVVVGPQRLPELGRTIGKALREFRKIQDDVKDTIKFDLNDEPEPYVRPKKSPAPSARSADGNGATPTALAERMRPRRRNCPTRTAGGGHRRRRSPADGPTDAEIDPEPQAAGVAGSPAA